MNMEALNAIMWREFMLFAIGHDEIAKAYAAKATGFEPGRWFRDLWQASRKDGE